MNQCSARINYGDWLPVRCQLPAGHRPERHRRLTVYGAPLTWEGDGANVHDVEEPVPAS